ncbi:MAG: methyltransferase domain-containing protein [Leucobacter sp.]
MNLSERDTRLLELMDDPDCDPQRLRRTLKRFTLINRVVSHWDGAYRSHLQPVLAGLVPRGRPVRLLDIGCGGGDVLRRIVQHARSDGIDVVALGIDPDSNAIEVANRKSTTHGVIFRETTSGTLVREGERFDIVVSNHLLHHLTAAEFDAVVADSEMLSTSLCVHSDIARSRLAFATYAAAAAPFSPGTFAYVDGLRSIRRSYTSAELEPRLPDGWRVEQPGCFRLLAVRGWDRDEAE